MKRLRRHYGRARRRVPMPDMSWLTAPKDAVRSTAGIHARAAEVLGWPLRDVQSMSLYTLRDVVRPVSAKLAHDITVAIRSGSYIT